MTYYQCEKECSYLFEDCRCGECTRMTPEEVVGGIPVEVDDND